MLKRFVNRFIRVLKSTKGYTLVEVAAVVAITGTLAAVAVPVAKNQIGAGKVAAAVQDVQAIAGAINQLKGDVGVAPVFKKAADRISSAPNVMLLSSRKGTMPTASTAWGADAQEGILSTATSITSVTSRGSITIGTGVDAFEDHLVQNGDREDSLRVIHDEKVWNGPYFNADKADPWGHKYLCNIGKLYDWNSNDDVPISAVVVISAGPDGIIQTGPNQLLSGFAVSGDDIAARVQ